MTFMVLVYGILEAPFLGIRVWRTVNVSLPSL